MAKRFSTGCQNHGEMSVVSTNSAGKTVHPHAKEWSCACTLHSIYKFIKMD